MGVLSSFHVDEETLPNSVIVVVFSHPIRCHDAVSGHGNVYEHVEPCTRFRQNDETTFASAKLVTLAARKMGQRVTAGLSDLQFVTWPPARR